MNTDRRSSRRALLGSLAAGAVVLAGCASSAGSDDGPGKRSEPPDGPPMLGDPEAAVTLEVFEDFNCPHCQDYNVEGFPEVREAYLDPGQIRYVHRDLPFIDPTSWQAACAAREVYRTYGTEPFFAYKSALMSEGSRIRDEAPAVFGDVAESQQLDADQIRAAGANRDHESTIREDRSRAEELGVRGTPGFVVDGEVVGRLADAREMIEQRLG